MQELRDLKNLSKELFGEVRMSSLRHFWGEVSLGQECSGTRPRNDQEIGFLAELL